MPTLVGPAADPVVAGTAEAWVDGDVLLAPLPPRVPDGPGDPDVEWDPTPPREGPRVQVLLGEAITRRVFGELVTADVDDWVSDVELLAGGPATILASSSDPLWASSDAIASSHVGADGRLKFEWNPKQYLVWIYLDGVCEWVGMFRQPVNIGGGRVVMPAQGPQEQYLARILGRPEQVDLLGDRGSFEGPDPLAGWVASPGVELEPVTGDGVRGDHCIRVRGNGWVTSPKVTAIGAEGYGRAVTGSTFGRWDESVAAGTPVILTWTQRTDSLGVSNADVTLQNAGARPDDSSGWTSAPVQSGTRMSDNAVAHRCWVGLRSFKAHWSYYDLATIRESIQTGFPPGTKRDLALYVPRIHRDLESRSLGGSPTGLTVRVKSLTGVLASMRWEHAARPPVHDVLSVVLDADGGPECRITTNWVLEVHGRLGADRDDIALTVHEVAAPAWQTDPGAQIDDYMVDTGRGSGVTALSATVSTAFSPRAWRIIAQVTGPTDRSLDEIESWARAHARSAGRIQSTGEADCPWAVAKQIADGDVLPLYLHDGDQGIARRVRILRHRWQPKRGRCILTWGNAEDA